MSNALGMVRAQASLEVKKPGSRVFLLHFLARVLQSMVWRLLIIPVVAAIMAVLGTFVLIIETLFGRSAPENSFVARACIYVLGDAWAFSANREILGDIVESVRSTAELLRSHVDRLVIVGHSQGGAIARYLTASEPGFTDGLVTVGSGANLLGFARTATKPFLFLQWVLVILAPAIMASGVLYVIEVIKIFTETMFIPLLKHPMAVYQGREELHEIPQYNFGLFKPLLDLFVSPVALAVAVLLVLQALVGRRLVAGPEMDVPVVKSWWDVGSILDPVCVGGGPYERYGLDRAVKSVEVLNFERYSEIWGEHTRYYQNAHVGRVLWACIGESCDGPGRQVVGPVGDAVPGWAISHFWLWGWLLAGPFAFWVLLGWGLV
ncbi:alpha/beta hydrolase [Kineosporia sp. NBRC 101677]|uniref:alpha/beta hydrolase n=1 Tax=Kineosporia sp. NBRC 101677 TaxID=3032197 RepID=UPI00255632CA|nr:alpha/beta hydrolase [Kineosporia sp. NBRC 101677]